MNARIPLALTLACCTACMGPRPSTGPPAGAVPQRFAQLMAGVADLAGDEALQFDADFGAELLDDGTEPSDMPLLGGAVQLARMGRTVQLGFEGGATLGRDHREGEVAISDIITDARSEVLLADLFAGLYVGTMLGERLRFYAGAGPVLQYARAEVRFVDDSGDPVAAVGSGLGLGLYGRAGVDVTVADGLLLGAGVRWIDSGLDLGGDVEELDPRAVQVVLTLSKSF